MSTVSVFTWFDNPPAVFGTCILKSLKFFVSFEVFHCHNVRNFDNICLRHEIKWVLKTHFSRILENILCKLTFRGNLINSIDVIIYLMWQYILYNLNSSYLRKDNIWKHRSFKLNNYCSYFFFLLFFSIFLCFTTFSTLIRWWFGWWWFLLIFFSGVDYKLLFNIEVSLLVWIMINPTQPISSSDGISDNDEVIAPHWWIFDPVFETFVFELEVVIHLNLVKPLSILVDVSWWTGLRCSVLFSLSKHQCNSIAVPGRSWLTWFFSFFRFGLLNLLK